MTRRPPRGHMPLFFSGHHKRDNSPDSRIPVFVLVTVFSGTAKIPSTRSQCTQPPHLSTLSVHEKFTSSLLISWSGMESEARPGRCTNINMYFCFALCTMQVGCFPLHMESEAKDLDSWDCPLLETKTGGRGGRRSIDVDWLNAELQLVMMSFSSGPTKRFESLHNTLVSPSSSWPAGGSEPKTKRTSTRNLQEEAGRSGTSTRCASVHMKSVLLRA